MGFQKKKLAFRNQAVFDRSFSPAVDSCFCVVARLVFEGRINVDGTINVEQAGYLKKGDVWSYIYYLYTYNHTSVEEFVAMKDEKGKASALRFYEVVKAVVQNQFVPEVAIVPLDVNTLIYFINLMCQRYGENMQNPVATFLQSMTKRPEVVHLSKLSVVTGQEPGAVNVITNANKAKNANVKVQFEYK